MQLTAPVTADRDQRRLIGRWPGKLFPGQLQDAIQHPGATVDQAADVLALTKGIIHACLSIPEGLLEHLDDRLITGVQTCLNRLTVEKFGNGHKRLNGTGHAGALGQGSGISWTSLPGAGSGFRNRPR